MHVSLTPSSSLPLPCPACWQVRPRGRTEDFDEDRVDQMRGAIEQLTGAKGTVVYFEEEEATFENLDGVLEIQSVGEIHRRGAARVISALLTELGLYVVQAREPPAARACS